jgi:hypothetical protein
LGCFGCEGGNKMKLKSDERTCPKCAETIKKAAAVCKHCGAEVTPDISKKPEATPQQTAIGCGIMLALVLMVATCSGAFEGSDDSGADAQKTAEDRRKGFHCLSAWDGSHSGLVEQVKASLRDPASFEHDETSITPVSEKGVHVITMKYRARNGFGGMNVQTAIGTVQQSDCVASLALSGS